MKNAFGPLGSRYCRHSSRTKCRVVHIRRPLRDSEGCASRPGREHPKCPWLRCRYAATQQLLHDRRLTASRHEVQRPKQSLPFPFIKVFHRRVMGVNASANIDPHRRIGNPISYRGWARRQLVSNDGWKGDSLKENGEYVDMADQHEIVDWSGISDDEWHSSGA